MTTENQIEKQLQEEFRAFELSVYKSLVEVPPNLIELLKKATLSLAPQFHQVLASRIKMIVSKQPDELTIVDLNATLKIIVNTPLEKLYGNDFDTAIESQIAFERYMLSFNQAVETFQKTLQEKKSRLQSLSGKMNGNLRIMPPNGQA